MNHLIRSHTLFIFILCFVLFRGSTNAQAQREHTIKIYAIKNDGTLWWYNYKPLAGSFDEPRQVRSDWQDVVQLFSSSGKLYVIKKDGTLWWYNIKNKEEGSVDWEEPKQVGSGWQDFKNVFSSNGRIYCIKKDGTLVWYHHLGAADGTFKWEEQKEVGSGWQNFMQVFGSGENIYAIKEDGTLLRYHHTGAANGTPTWEEPKEVKSGLHIYQQVFASYNRIYAVRNDGSVWLYDDIGKNNSNTSLNDPKKIGDGWDNVTKATSLSFEDIPSSPSAAPVASNPPPKILLPPMEIGAFEIKGAIREKYKLLGRLPGKAVSAEITASNGGVYQKFEGCIIYWHPSIGAYEVHGDILKLYQLKGADKTVGYPITDEMTCPDGKGKYNHFKKQMSNGTWAYASIYSIPRKGTFLIYGAIREKWESLGWERGELGYPTSDEYQKGATHVQDFEKKRIVYSASKGAVIEEYKYM